MSCTCLIRARRDTVHPITRSEVAAGTVLFEIRCPSESDYRFLASRLGWSHWEVIRSDAEYLHGDRTDLTIAELQKRLHDAEAIVDGLRAKVAAKRRDDREAVVVAREQHTPPPSRPAPAPYGTTYTRPQLVKIWRDRKRREMADALRRAGKRGSMSPSLRPDDRDLQALARELEGDQARTQTEPLCLVRSGAGYYVRGTPPMALMTTNLAEASRFPQSRAEEVMDAFETAGIAGEVVFEADAEDLAGDQSSGEKEAGSDGGSADMEYIYYAAQYDEEHDAFVAPPVYLGELDGELVRTDELRQATSFANADAAQEFILELVEDGELGEGEMWAPLKIGTVPVGGDEENSAGDGPGDGTGDQGDNEGREPHALEAVTGIGPQRAQQLVELGIEDLDALASLDYDAEAFRRIAEADGIGPSNLGRWIDDARARHDGGGG